MNPPTTFTIMNGHKASTPIYNTWLSAHTPRAEAWRCLGLQTIPGTPQSQRHNTQRIPIREEGKKRRQTPTTQPPLLARPGEAAPSLKLTPHTAAGRPFPLRVLPFRVKGFLKRRLRRGPPGPPADPHLPPPPQDEGKASAPPPRPGHPPGPHRGSSAARPGDPAGGLSPPPRPPALGPARAAGPLTVLVARRAALRGRGLPRGAGPARVNGGGTSGPRRQPGGRGHGFSQQLLLTPARFSSSSSFFSAPTAAGRRGSPVRGGGGEGRGRPTGAGRAGARRRARAPLPPPRPSGR